MIVIYEKIILLKGQLSKCLTEKIQSLKNKNKHAIFKKSARTGMEIEKYMFGGMCCSFESKISQE